MSKSKGYARIEFIANLDEIRALHKKGFNKKMIYDHLIEERKITMSYQCFCSYNLDGLRKKHLSYNPEQQGKEQNPLAVKEKEKTWQQ